MNPTEVKKYLDSFVNFEIQLQKKKLPDFTLNNIKKLLGLLHDPQNDLKIVHVAGSKGKGSVCAMTASILKEAGYKVGLFTSPHMEDLKERIRVLDKTRTCADKDPAGGEYVFEDQINEAEFCETVEEIKWALDKIEGLTYFEVLTAAAFIYFKKKKVDLVVLEAGLGGRLDATNMASSVVCAITSIGLEHVNILGDTMEKIAKEKAAIIKDLRQKVVFAPQDEQALKALTNRCKEFDIEPLIVGRDVSFEALTMDEGTQSFNLFLNDRINGLSAGFEKISTPLLGRHQLINAAVSLGVIFSLRDSGFDISDEAVYKGFRSVRFPGRFEIINKNPHVILDGAHNEESMACLVETFSKVFPGRKCNLLLGISNDKDRMKISKTLRGVVNEIIATKASHPRAATFSKEQMLEMFPGKICSIEDDIKKAVIIALEKTGKADVLLVTGSLFIAAEARTIMIKKLKGKG